jgi:rhamnosyltransferase
MRVAVVFIAVSSVCALVVTYHPWAEVVANIEAIRTQVDRVVVIDNGSGPAGLALLAPLAARPGIELILNPDNRGIAAALNQGVERALAGDFDWIATFDQDSTVPPGFFSGLLRAWAEFPDRQRVAVMAPLCRDGKTGTLYSPAGAFGGDARGTVPVNMAATSGNLIPARVLRELGGYRTDFFIDCVDHEFCLRARRLGWLVVEARDVVMNHHQGHWQRRRLFTGDVGLNDYPPQRRYYQARNRLIVYARYLVFDPRWLAHDARDYAREFVKLLLVGEHRWVKLCAIGEAVWDALLGRMGPRRS